MKVLHLISSGGMYGAEAVILNLSCELRARGHASELALFTSATQGNDALREAAGALGLRCHSVHTRGPIDRSVGGQVRRIVRETGADILHAHGYKADVYAWTAMRGIPSTLVSTCHTWYDNSRLLRLYGRLDRWALRDFAAVVAVSAEVAVRLRGAGVPPFHVHRVLNGVELPATAHTPRELPVAIGLVGRLEREKGVDIFLRAAALIHATHPAIRFVVAGDGPDRAQLTGLAAELGLGECVEFAGRICNVADLYEWLDVLVSASRQEGLPVALLEGMAHGLPLVATRAGEVPELVLDRTTGLLVHTEDPRALAEAVTELLDDHALRARLGAAARERIRTRFSAARMTDAYLRVYNDALRVSDRHAQ